MMLRSLSAVIAAGLLFPLPGSAQTFRYEPTLPPQPMIGFAASFAMSGDEVFVGRPDRFAMFPMPPAKAGGVHVFGRDGDQWVERLMVTAEGVEIGDAFGQAVSVDGNTLAVGAPGRSDGSGAVYVFERDAPGETWALVALLTADDGSADDALGQSVVVRGGTVVAGAPGHDGARGAAYVFRRESDGRWSRQAMLTASDASDEGQFGFAVDFDGERALIGAPGPLPFQIVGTPSPPQPGAAYLFAPSAAGEWTEMAKLATPAEGITSLGFSVNLAADGAAVSAPVSGGGAGAVVMFGSRAASEWVEEGVVRPTGPEAGSLFGFAVAWSPSFMLVGAPAAGGGQGAVYAFDRGSSGGWTQSQRLTARLTGMAPFFGGAVVADQRSAMIGAPGADFFEGVGFHFERNGQTGMWEERSSFIDDTPGLQPIVGGQVDCDDGTIEIFGCSDVDLLAFLPVKSLGAGRGVMVNDIWGWTDSMTGREYALVGRTDATAFVDLGDPANPVYLGALPLHEGANINIWRDIKVYANHAFIVADGAGAHGVQVFDLTQLRDVRNPPVTFEETAHYDGIFSAHNIVINEETGYAYSVGSSAGGETCGGGLHMINVQDPKNPTFAGCFSDPATGNARTGYSHDAQCIVYHGPDEDYRGKEICFGSNETALSIADVSDKSNPVPIASASYPNVAYAHQGWVSDDHRYFFMDDEGDEIVGSVPRTRTLVWDIEDLDDPVLATEFLGTTSASDHNLYVRGRYMYQSNYVSGLRVIDVLDPVNPVEVGYFDTVPFGADVAGFAGSWSNYPYFESGVIVVTSMREGLFVLKKRDTRPIP